MSLRPAEPSAGKPAPLPEHPCSSLHPSPPHLGSKELQREICVQWALGEQVQSGATWRARETAKLHSPGPAATLVICMVALHAITTRQRQSAPSPGGTGGGRSAPRPAARPLRRQPHALPSPACRSCHLTHEPTQGNIDHICVATGVAPAPRPLCGAQRPPRRPHILALVP